MQEKQDIEQEEKALTPDILKDKVIEVIDYIKTRRYLNYWASKHNIAMVNCKKGLMYSVEKNMGSRTGN